MEISLFEWSCKDCWIIKINEESEKKQIVFVQSTLSYIVQHTFEVVYVRFHRCVLLLLSAKLHVELVEEVIIEEMSVLF